MPIIAQPRNGSPAHLWRLTRLAEPDRAKLESSGITATTATANQLRTEDSEMVIPFRSLAGAVNGYAMRRPHNPSGGAKYLSPPGESLRPYWPAGAIEKLENKTAPLFITEGPLKAMALDQVGHLAAGVSGVNGGQVKGSTKLLDELAKACRGRTCYIVFDADVKPITVANVNKAKQRLAKGLLAAGAKQVYDVALPLGPGDEKQGVDDYLVAHNAASFARLVKLAEPIDAEPAPELLATAAEQLPEMVIRLIPPVLGEAAYHGQIGEFLRAVAPYTEATEAGMLAHLLPAIGTLIGPAPHVFAGSHQPPRVNFVLVGKTNGGRKGTSSSPVNYLMKEVDPRFWNAQYRSGISSGEGLIQMVADKEGKDEDGNDCIIKVEKRVMVEEPEFSRLLANIRREGNIASQVLRQAFDSGKLETLTVNPREANGAHISAVGHITPEELKAKVTSDDAANGFGNRFVWFYVESEKFLPFTKPMPPELFTQFAGRLRTLLTLGCHAEPFAVEMEPKAQELWIQVYSGLREDRPGLAGAITARGAPIVLRLALIYCLTERWAYNKIPKLSVEHLQAALAVWRYGEQSAQQLFSPKRDRLADKLLNLLAAGPLTKTELNKHLGPKEKKVVDATLARMLEAKDIRKSVQKQPGRGRPKTTYELTPKATKQKS